MAAGSVSQGYSLCVWQSGGRDIRGDHKNLGGRVREREGREWGPNRSTRSRRETSPGVPKRVQPALLLGGTARIERRKGGDDGSCESEGNRHFGGDRKRQTQQENPILVFLERFFLDMRLDSGLDREGGGKKGKKRGQVKGRCWPCF